MDYSDVAGWAEYVQEEFGDISQAPAERTHHVMHAILVMNDLGWSTQKEFLSDRLCGMGLGRVVDMTRAVNWTWQARKLEHEIDELCCVCVSRILRTVLFKRRAARQDAEDDARFAQAIRYQRQQEREEQ